LGQFACDSGGHPLHGQLDYGCWRVLQTETGTVFNVKTEATTMSTTSPHKSDEFDVLFISWPSTIDWLLAGGRIEPTGLFAMKIRYEHPFLRRRDGEKRESFSTKRWGDVTLSKSHIK
ncbi:unnamed protein product, partial [Ectocarpus fasciculatus]